MDDKFQQLAPLVLDLLTAPASEAHVERIFSLHGDLTTGKCNRMQEILECKVFPKLNSSIFND